MILASITRRSRPLITITEEMRRLVGLRISLVEQPPDRKVYNLLPYELASSCKSSKEGEQMRLASTKNRSWSIGTTREAKYLHAEREREKHPILYIPRIARLCLLRDYFQWLKMIAVKTLQSP